MNEKLNLISRGFPKQMIQQIMDLKCIYQKENKKYTEPTLRQYPHFCRPDATNPKASAIKPPPTRNTDPPTHPPELPATALRSRSNQNAILSPALANESHEKDATAEPSSPPVSGSRSVDKTKDERHPHVRGRDGGRLGGAGGVAGQSKPWRGLASGASFSFSSSCSVSFGSNTV